MPELPDAIYGETVIDQWRFTEDGKQTRYRTVIPAGVAWEFELKYVVCPICGRVNPDLAMK